MVIIPAIDIKNGKCVRLLQGNPDKETIYSDSPVDMAKSFEDAGAKLIHVVDLDGAFSGETINSSIVKDIAKSISIPIEIGGGIRTEESIKMYSDAGIKRIILGTRLLQDNFKDIAEKFAKYLVAGIDARDSMVAVKGWKEVTSIAAFDMINELQNIGINDVIYTDIATDGMLTGPNYDAIKSLLHDFPEIKLVASGGVSSMEDLEKLSEIKHKGLTGCIVGKAIYDGQVNLKKAIIKYN